MCTRTLLCRHYVPWLADGIAREAAAESARALQGGNLKSRARSLPAATEDTIREYFTAEFQLHDFALQVHQQQLQHVRGLSPAGAGVGMAGAASEAASSSGPAIPSGAGSNAG